MAPAERPQLADLLDAFCNDALDEAGCSQLDGLLRADGAARRAYADQLFLHAELYALHASVEVESRASQHVPEPVVPRGRRRASTFGWLAVAAALVAVSAVSSWVTYAATRGLAQAATGVAGSSPGTDPLVEPTDTVATVTATRNCLWPAASQRVGFGSRLHAGQQLSLEAGLVEISFDDGAMIVLEGPARLDVRASGEAQLHEGRLAAVVPEEARGFVVATNRLNVVDLGTEFGIVAEAEGSTEVHVFNGLVEAHLFDERGQALRTVSLATAEAARVEPDTALVAMIPAHDNAFVRSLTVAAGPSDGLYAYEGFDYPAGPLAEQNGGFGWGGPWFNLADEGESDEHTNAVAIGSLQYTGMGSLGNRAVQFGHQNRIRRSLSTSLGGVFDAAGLVEEQDGMRLVGRDGTTIYLSFLQRVDRTADVFYGLELHRSDGNANRVLSIGHGAEETGYGVTSNFNVYGPRNFPALGEENTEANFFVVRITFGPGNRDMVEVMRNPGSLVDEHACQVDAVLTGNFAFDRIGFGNYFGTKIHEIDEIRIGTTFLAVTGRPSRGPDQLQRRMANDNMRDGGGSLWSRRHVFREELALVGWQWTADR